MSRAFAPLSRLTRFRASTWASVSVGIMTGFAASTAHAALPRLRHLEIEWEGLEIAEFFMGMAGSVRGCLTQIGLFAPVSAGARGPGSCGGSVILDVAFLVLLVIAVITVVAIRQRSEQHRLELARRYLEQGINPPGSLFPTAATNDLRRGIILVCAGLGCLCATFAASGWSPAAQSLGPVGFIPGFIGLGYLISYACAKRAGTPP